MRKLLLVIIICSLSLAVKAQKPDTAKYKSASDSLILKKDSATSQPFVPRVTRVVKDKVYHPDSLHSPHKAVMRSLIIPGWGQLYNHHWWKVPIIYGGLGATFYYIISNNKEYKRFIRIAEYQRDPFDLKNPPAGRKNITDANLADYAEYGNKPAQAVTDFAEYNRRNRDLCILGFVLGWGVQTIDAYIWAKFKHSYSMDNDLGLHFSGGLTPQPAYASNLNTTFMPTLKLTLTLK